MINTTVAPLVTTTVAPTTTTTVRLSTTTTVAPAASAATVTTNGFAYTPTSVRISVGQSVAFDVSSAHDVRWQDGNTGRGATGAAYSRTFSNAGTYSFYCSIHTEMTGTITVG
jgi:plastocyanin